MTAQEEAMREYAGVLAKAAFNVSMPPEAFAEVCGMAVAIYSRLHLKLTPDAALEMADMLPLIAKGAANFDHMEVHVVRVPKGAENASH